MGGSNILEGGDIEPLLLEICLRCDARNLFDIGRMLVTQLDQPCQEQVRAYVHTLYMRTCTHSEVIHVHTVRIHLHAR